MSKSMENLTRSVRIPLHQPRYVLLAVITRAIGIGVTTAMFGLLDAVDFRPLPIAHPDRLVDITLVSANNRFSVLSYEEFRDNSAGLRWLGTDRSDGRLGDDGTGALRGPWTAR
jgi:hypothetical protein